MTLYCAHNDLAMHSVSKLMEMRNMDQLIALVVERAGISEEAARQAVETVLQFLKGRLPGPLGEQLDGVLGGGGADASSVLGGLGGLLGKR